MADEFGHDEGDPAVSFVAPAPAENPIPTHAFVATLKGTADEVWSRLMQIEHRLENHTHTEWRKLLEAKRHLPAHTGAR